MIQIRTPKLYKKKKLKLQHERQCCNSKHIGQQEHPNEESSNIFYDFYARRNNLLYKYIPIDYRR